MTEESNEQRTPPPLAAPWKSARSRSPPPVLLRASVTSVVEFLRLSFTDVRDVRTNGKVSLWQTGATHLSLGNSSFFDIKPDGLLIFRFPVVVDGHLFSGLDVTEGDELFPLNRQVEVAGVGLVAVVVH